MDDLIFKSFDVNLVDSDSKEKGAITALVVPFGNVDKQGDRIVEGSYTKSLDKWRRSGKSIPMIFAHGWKNPFNHIGYWDPNQCQEVVATSKHPAGLLMKGVVDVGYGNPVADWVHRLMSTGRINQFSQGFLVPKGGEGRNKSDFANDIFEVDLIEAGPTLAGVNPDTVLMELKSIGMEHEGASHPDGDELGIRTKNQDLAAAIRKIIAALQTALEEYEASTGTTDVYVEPTITDVATVKSDEEIEIPDEEIEVIEEEDYRQKAVEWTPFDGNAALELAESTENALEALEQMCAGRVIRKSEDEPLRSEFRLVHHSTPDGPPNVHAVESALARMDQPHTRKMLINYGEAREHLMQHKSVIDEVQTEVVEETQDEIDVDAIQDYLAKASLELLDSETTDAADVTDVTQGHYHAATVGRVGAKMHELHKSVRGMIIQNNLSDEDEDVLTDIANRIKSVGREFLDANLADNDTEMIDNAVVKARMLRSDIDSVRDIFVAGDDSKQRVYSTLGDPILKVFNTYLHDIEMSRG